MPLFDLSLVTKTLLSLIETSMKDSLKAAQMTLPGTATLTVSPLPPDKLTAPYALGLYLYHAAEDPHYKNLPLPAPDAPPIRYTPMGVDLFYQLSPHCDPADNPQSWYWEQTLIGLAMKALHDFPSLDDSSEIDGAPIFPAALQGTGTRLRLSLLPVQQTDAPHYWTAGSQPLRLAAYYHVSVVLLQPDKPVKRTGRVLMYGIETFVRGAPRLEGSKSVVTFRLPGEPQDRSIEVQPAEASVGGAIRFSGSDLAGDATSLVIKGPRFTEAVEVSSDWGVAAGTDFLCATIQAAAGNQTILPGLYSASARVLTGRQMPDQTVREFRQSSNEVPFVVAPRIASVSAPPPNVITVTGGVFQFNDPNPPGQDVLKDAVQVFVGPVNLPRRTVGALQPGEFEVVDASTLRFEFPVPDLKSNDTVPLRIIVNGAESAPRWLTVP